MALIIEDGTGMANAQAYADATAFAVWHLAFYGTPTTATNPQAEGAILRAVAYLDGLAWIGIPANGRVQALAWPRGNAVDRNGYGIEGVPREVIEAQHMLTVAEINTPGALAPSVIAKDQKVLVEVKGIKWQPLAAGASPSSARTTVLAALDRLRGLIAPVGAVPLQRA